MNGLLDAATPAAPKATRATRATTVITNAAGAARRAVGAAWSLLRTPSPVRRVMVATLIDATGTGVFYTVSALFLRISVGLPRAQVGAVLAVAGAVALVGALPAGWLNDRLGSRRTVVGFFAARAVAHGSLLLVHSFWPALLCMSLATWTDRGSAPLIGALVVDRSEGADRVASLAAVQAMKNAAFSVGGLIAALALAVGTAGAYRATVAFNVATFLAALPFLLRVPADRPVVRKVLFARGPLRDRRFATAVVLHGLLSLHASVLAIAMPLWLVERTSMPRFMVAVLLTENTVTAALAQVAVSRSCDSPAQAVRYLRRAGHLLVPMCLAFPLTALSAFSALGAAPAALLAVGLIGVLTAGELFHSAGSAALSVHLAPEAERGQYFALMSLGFTAQTIVGPPLVLWAVGRGGGGWLVLASVFMVPLVILAVLRRPLADACARNQ